MIENPFFVNPEEISLDFQIEIIELQCSGAYKSKFKGNKCLEKEKFRKLTETQQTFVFLETYVYANKSLQNSLRISTSHLTQ